MAPHGQWPSNNYLYTFTELRTTIPLSAVGLADVVVDAPAPVALALGLGSVVVFAVLIFFVLPRVYATERALVVAGKPVREPSWAFAHHFAMFLYSFAVFSVCLGYVALSGELTAPSFATFACTPLPPWLRLVSMSFVASKIVEWVDTVVLFARGGSVRSIGFLHLYHHATTFLLFLICMWSPAEEKLGMILNGFVHTCVARGARVC